VLGFVAIFGRLQPKVQLALVASCALIAVTAITGIVLGTQSAGGTVAPGGAQITAPTVPPAEPTVAGVSDDERLGDVEPSETSETRERAAKERVRARASAKSQKRARAKRRQALQRERRRNTAQLQSGVTCADLGQTDILVVPGASIDGDGDGIGCES
jgi:type IV secretory pathway VirB10-like protein